MTLAYGAQVVILQWMIFERTIISSDVMRLYISARLRFAFNCSRVQVRRSLCAWQLQAKLEAQHCKRCLFRGPLPSCGCVPFLREALTIRTGHIQQTGRWVLPDTCTLCDSPVSIHKLRYRVVLCLGTSSVSVGWFKAQIQYAQRIGSAAT